MKIKVTIKGDYYNNEDVLKLKKLFDNFAKKIFDSPRTDILIYDDEAMTIHEDE